MFPNNGHQRDDFRWTRGLALRLLGDLPDEEVQGLLANANGARPTDVRAHLLQRANEQPRLRGQIMDAWRRRRQHVVTATEMIHLVAGDAASSAETLLQHFDAEDVLLELITDPHEDGWPLAEEFVLQIPLESLRFQLLELLRTWSDEGADEREPSSADGRVRVVVFGGHPRDESRLAPLFADGPFDVRWRTWERRAGDSADTKMVAAALAHAEAAIIVTGMASHNMMDMARGFAKKHGIAWTCITKATGTQLNTALRELFSELQPVAGRERR